MRDQHRCSLPIVRNYATFQASFPDDLEEDESGRIIAPGGRTIAQAMAARIPGASDAYQHSFYGWEVDFRTASGRRAFVILQEVIPWLLIVDGSTGWFARASTKQARLAEAVEIVRAALDGIPEVTDVKWWTRQEFEQSPV